MSAYAANWTQMIYTVNAMFAYATSNPPDNEHSNMWRAAEAARSR